MVASNVVRRSNFIFIHTYYIHFLQYLIEQNEKVLSLTVYTSAILSRGSFLLSFKYTWFPAMINKKPTVGYVVLLLWTSFVPFCFIFFNSSFLFSIFSNVSYDLLYEYISVFCNPTFVPTCAHSFNAACNLFSETIMPRPTNSISL